MRAQLGETLAKGNQHLQLTIGGLEGTSEFNPWPSPNSKGVHTCHMCTLPWHTQIAHHTCNLPYSRHAHAYHRPSPHTYTCADAHIHTPYAHIHTQRVYPMPSQALLTWAGALHKSYLLAGLEFWHLQLLPSSSFFYQDWLETWKVFPEKMEK